MYWNIKYFLFQIDSMTGSDGGNYTCSPQNILSDTVLVTIMEGDGTFAAVHKDALASSDTNLSNKNSIILTIVIHILIIYVM